MLSEIDQALSKYQKEWQRLVEEREDRDFFNGLQPITVAWKTVDRADFDQRLAGLMDHCDQIHLGWLDERWLATLHLKASSLPWGIDVIKLMQRRPGSTDAVGLDHVDFLVPETADARTVLAAEPNLNWSDEHGGYASWTSIWFAGGPEAKLRYLGSTTCDAIVAEINEAMAH